jgi:indole-3-glycerol phosphate synthase
VAATLEQILAATRRRVEAARENADLNDLERRVSEHEPRGFRQALLAAANCGPAIIAELKPASPSRGIIRKNFSAAPLAKELAAAGAAALSVLTEPEFFLGSLGNLTEASDAVKLPCLCKDFFLEEFQLLQARAHGADAVLLIVAALSDSQLRGLLTRARQLQLDALCEVHDEKELDRALASGCDVIGVNSRDLRTFLVAQKNLFTLAQKLPKSVLRVAESGLHSGAELRELAAAGYQAFLIGEWLMRAPSPGEALKKIIFEFKTSHAEAVSKN